MPLCSVLIRFFWFDIARLADRRTSTMRARLGTCSQRPARKTARRVRLTKCFVLRRGSRGVSREYPSGTADVPYARRDRWSLRDISARRKTKRRAKSIFSNISCCLAWPASASRATTRDVLGRRFARRLVNSVPTTKVRNRYVLSRPMLFPARMKCSRVRNSRAHKRAIYKIPAPCIVVAV